MNFNAFEPGHLIYTFYLILLLFFTLVNYNRTNRQNLIVFVIFIIAQILIGGLRSYQVGTDTGIPIHLFCFHFSLYFGFVWQLSYIDILVTVFSLCCLLYLCDLTFLLCRDSGKPLLWG